MYKSTAQVRHVCKKKKIINHLFSSSEEMVKKLEESDISFKEGDKGESAYDVITELQSIIHAHK